MAEQPPLHLICSIGKGSYPKATYRLDQSAYTSRFAPVALARLLDLRGARASILVTREAHEAWYEPLAWELRETGVQHDVPCWVRIPQNAALSSSSCGATCACPTRCLLRPGHAIIWHLMPSVKFVRASGCAAEEAAGRATEARRVVRAGGKCELAAGQGFEPQLLDPESSVLPLDDPAPRGRLSVSIPPSKPQIARRALLQGLGASVIE